MRIFVAGATGALGTQLVPQLVEAGHDVTAMTRSESKADLVRGLGAEPVIADALDAEAVGAAVAAAKPEVVINQLTAISDVTNWRKPDADFVETNRLRTEGTDIMLSAAIAAGARRYIGQSFAPWAISPGGPAVKDEAVPMRDEAPKGVAETLEGIRYLESAVAGAEGIEGVVLRYGGFYGPGTNLAGDGEMTEMVRKRRMPVLGEGSGIWSFIHIADAASATVAAVERGEPGVYNVTDDEPARVNEWLPVLAEDLGAKRPMRVPGFIARLVAGPAVYEMMNGIRGASNAKAKRELAWTPRFASWRDGFASGLS